MVANEPTLGARGDRIRVTLDLRRSDDPALFEALASLSKGRRRIARLRMLAHDGLLASEVMASGVGTRFAPGAPKAADDAALEERTDLAPLDAQVTIGIFSAPLSR